MVKSAPLHPFFLAMAVIGITTGLFSVSQRYPPAAPIVLVLSLIGLMVRVGQLGGSRALGDGTVGSADFDALHAKDIRSFGLWLKENVRGHDPVIDRVVRSLQQGLSLAAPNRTLGNIMLVGPTGTGKSYLAELVAKALYPQSEPLVLRMNQYKHHDDVFTLLGPPPGQPGYEVGGALTRPVLENPRRVILLDEIDKSHPDVRDCLYNVLDNAQCREKSSGKMVHFSACAIFATCNVGADSLRGLELGGASDAERIGRTRDALFRSGGFEKAFLSRFNEICLMDELSHFHVGEVACLQYVKHWRDYGIEVTYASPEILVETIRKNVEFKEYGVRQLFQLIQSMTDSSIEKARQAGARKVRLDIVQKTGEIRVQLLGG